VTFTGATGRALSSYLLADKAYDSDEFRAVLAERNCTAVIPSNASQAQRLAYDKELTKHASGTFMGTRQKEFRDRPVSRHSQGDVLGVAAEKAS
jgi:hypothetical protein